MNPYGEPQRVVCQLRAQLDMERGQNAITLQRLTKTTQMVRVLTENLKEQHSANVFSKNVLDAATEAHIAAVVTRFCTEIQQGTKAADIALRIRDTVIGYAVLKGVVAAIHARTTHTEFEDFLTNTAKSHNIYRADLYTLTKKFLAAVHFKKVELDRANAKIVDLHTSVVKKNKEIAKLRAALAEATEVTVEEYQRLGDGKGIEDEPSDHWDNDYRFEESSIPPTPTAKKPRRRTPIVLKKTTQGEFCCTPCNRKFNTEQGLKVHRARKCNQVTCPICSRKFARGAIQHHTSVCK